MVLKEMKAQLVLTSLFFGCATCSIQAEEAKTTKSDGYVRPEINGPVLNPTEAIEKMHVAEGFKLNLFAAEPHATPARRQSCTCSMPTGTLFSTTNKNVS